MDEPSAQPGQLDLGLTESRCKLREESEGAAEKHREQNEQPPLRARDVEPDADDRRPDDPGHALHEQERTVVWSGLREKAEAYAFTLQQWHLTAVLEPDETR